VAHVPCCSRAVCRPAVPLTAADCTHPYTPRNGSAVTAAAAAVCTAVDTAWQLLDVHDVLITVITIQKQPW
jgi:hypothetical protein